MGAKGVVKALAARSEARNELIVVLQTEGQKVCLATLDLTCVTTKQDVGYSLKVYRLTYEVDAQYGQSESDIFPQNLSFDHVVLNGAETQLLVYGQTHLLVIPLPSSYQAAQHEFEDQKRLH